MILHILKIISLMSSGFKLIIIKMSELLVLNVTSSVGLKDLIWFEDSVTPTILICDLQTIIWFCLQEICGYNEFKCHQITFIIVLNRVFCNVMSVYVVNNCIKTLTF